jgi:hypothetical protein
MKRFFLNFGVKNAFLIMTKIQNHNKKIWVNL